MMILKTLPLISFWQFGSSWMLLWGLAAALPILLHFWSRRHFKEEPWAAMTFLIAAMRKNSRRIRVEQWLLLAMRMAILVLFALALSDPRLSLLPNSSAEVAGGESHIVLVIDGSYSMDFRSGERSRFTAAKELARQLVRDGKQGDGYTLVLMGQPPKTIIAQPAFDPEDVLEEIDNLILPHGGANLVATLAEVQAILSQAEQAHPRLTQKRVCIFTDMQQTTWGEAASAECRAKLAQLERQATLSLIDLAQPGEQNVAISRLEVSQPMVTTHREVQIVAELQSFASSDWARQAVEILVDGERVADQRVDIPAGGRMTVAATHRFDTVGDHVVEARLAPDLLPLDNQRWLSVPVRETIRVLAIGGGPGDTRHIALALAPQKSAERSLLVHEATESELIEADLSAYECVILSNIGRISREEASVLRAFLERGGGLITFLGDQIQPESYNQELIGSPDESGETAPLLPAKIGEFAEPGTYRLNPLEYEHPIVAVFRGHLTSGLLTTPIWKYARLMPLPNAKIALAFDNGDPALVETRVGRGRSILCATAASPEPVDRTTTPPTPWTALSSWPSFPPLMHEMLNHAIVGRAESRNVVVGDDLSGVLDSATAEAQVTLLHPDGSSEKLLVSTDGRETRWSRPYVTTSGIYEAQAGTIKQKFAVNVNTRESDLTRYDPELLAGYFSRELFSSEDASPSLLVDGGKSYFRVLLCAMLALLICEPCLAWYFGRGSG